MERWSKQLAGELGSKVTTPSRGSRRCGIKARPFLGWAWRGRWTASVLASARPTRRPNVRARFARRAAR